MQTSQTKADAAKSDAISAAGSGQKLVIQRKLEMGEVNDPLELEADKVADRVMRMPDQPFVQRKCASCDEEERRGVQRKEIASTGSETSTSAAPAIVHEALNSSSEPLDTGMRTFMESRFGYDFGNVRVHTDARAAESAQAVNAHAYTVGRDVVFGAGKYAPNTNDGQRLMAHELTHVMQQNRSQANAEGIVRRFEARRHESVERVGLTGTGALTNEEASAVYFGNWMRDMNQVFVPLLTRLMPSDVLFSFISYMVATKFGRELTPEQFGYYIPSEHMDNPGGLVHSDDLIPSQPVVPVTAQPPIPSRLGASRPANMDTLQEDVSPSGTVQGVNIFAVDQSGVMAYIRRTNLHIERRLQLAADLGRNPDGMHHFGAALHAVEDLFAHSNYIEIAIDRLLRRDPTFLPQLTDQGDRQLFTYAPRVRVGGVGGTPAEERPVLTTGTFTSTDTQISIASEVVGLLARPLSDPRGNEEQDVQDRFVVSLLRNFETRVRSTPELQQAVTRALSSAGVPDFLASRADQMPIADIYQMKTFMRIPIPDAIKLPLKRSIRDIVSRVVLQPLSGRVQAASLEARIEDTSLIQVLRESQRQQRGQFSAAERESMQQQQRFTGQSVAQQEADTRATGGRRVQTIQSTPLPVVAGPSHSQIAKDHQNSPFFGVAFMLSVIAVQRLCDRMLAAWAERHGSPTTPFNFEWANFPQAAPSGITPEQTEVYEQARRLYHAGRGVNGRNLHGRSLKEGESQHSGQEVMAQGGQPGQPFDLALMRQQSAANIRSIALVLQMVAGAPNAAATAIIRIRSLLGEIVPEVEQRIRRELISAQTTATTAGASQTVTDLNVVAAMLTASAASVEAARRHLQREQANAGLVQRRAEMLNALARQPGLDSALGTTLLYALDKEIQATAVAYSSEQRAVLEGGRSVPEMGASPNALSVQTLNLPPVTGSPATQALLTESRLLVAHPYDSTWWEQPVRSYAQRFASRLINDIEARNEGVPLYRTP
jgi:hypothetical protein